MPEHTPLFPALRPSRREKAAAAALGVVSRLLWLANSSPPHVGRDAFYAMKDRLLRRWGRPAGHDWQEITRECYGCSGSGRYTYLEGDSAECRRCGGTGVYDRFWVRLERWELAGRVFHRPAERSYRRPAEPVGIVGRIEHARVGRAGQEAALWLALAFDRPLFRRLMTASRAIDSTWRYPLVTLQKATFTLGMLRRKFAARRCTHCGRRFRQGFRHWRSHSLVCGRCDRRSRRGTAAIDPDDVPF